VFGHFVPVFRYKVNNRKPTEQKNIHEQLWETKGVVYARTHKKDIFCYQTSPLLQVPI